MGIGGASESTEAGAEELAHGRTAAVDKFFFFLVYIVASDSPTLYTPHLSLTCERMNVSVPPID
jgi:hypothetical protein